MGSVLSPASFFGLVSMGVLLTVEKWSGSSWDFSFATDLKVVAASAGLGGVIGIVGAVNAKAVHICCAACYQWLGAQIECPRCGSNRWTRL